MKVKKLFHPVKPPCPECPYTLGLVHTLVDPCPECRENGYRTFGRLKREVREIMDGAANEEEGMTKIKELIYRIKPPCPECPYTLGLVHTFVSPCPECRENGYRTFERFKRGMMI